MAAAAPESEMRAYAEKACAAFDKRTALRAQMVSEGGDKKRDWTGEIAVDQMKTVCDDLETSVTRADNYVKLATLDLPVALPRFKNLFKVKNDGKVMRLFSPKGELLSSVDALR